MVKKLIACTLGLNILFSTGLTTLAEADLASAGFDVQDAANVQPAVEPAAPSATEGQNTGETPAPAGNAEAGDNAQTGSEQNAGQTSSDGQQASSGTVSPTGGEGQSQEGDGAASGSGAADSGSVSEDSGSSSASEASKSESTAASSEEKEEDKEDEKDERKVVGFTGIAAIVVAEKPTLDKALSLLPTVVEAVLTDGNKIRIPVDWVCTVNYEEEKADRFTFASSPKKNADGTPYDIGFPIAEGVSFPNAEIVIEKKTEDKKETRKESSDPITEDAPLVMDDVTAAGISPEEGEEHVFLYLLENLGLNRAAACGVLANIHYESGFNSHAIGDGGTSYGLCQWHAGRYLSLVSYCSSAGLSYGSVEGQLSFLREELTNNYPGVLEYLWQIPETEVGAFDAAYYWCYYFERPAMILRQSTLRGNAAKNSYWPRYRDVDIDTLAGKESTSVSDEKKLALLSVQLDEVSDQESKQAEVTDTEQEQTVEQEMEPLQSEDLRYFAKLQKVGDTEEPEQTDGSDMAYEYFAF